MSGYRCEAEAFAGPARERLLYGARELLVRVRLHDGPGAVDDHGRPTNLPDAYTDLRPEQARQLALGCCRRPRTPSGRRSKRTGGSRRWRERYRDSVDCRIDPSRSGNETAGAGQEISVIMTDDHRFDCRRSAAGCRRRSARSHQRDARVRVRAAGVRRAGGSDRRRLDRQATSPPPLPDELDRLLRDCGAIRSAAAADALATANSQRWDTPKSSGCRSPRRQPPRRCHDH